MTLLALRSVTVEMGGVPLLSDIDVAIGRGERWGVVGRNGSGKTTLLRLATGDLEPTRGTVVRQAGVRVALLDQHRHFEDAETVWDAAAAPLAPLLRLEQSVTEQATAIGELGDRCPPELLGRYDRDLERLIREDGYAASARVDAVLEGLAFDPAEARLRRPESLSGGERGRLALARQLVAPADVLLLDEPTNHLDLETTAWLERYLLGANEAIVAVSHDRDFLAKVADHVLHLERGTAYTYETGYDAFVHQRVERRMAEARAFEKQRKTIAAEEDFIRRNIAGNNSRQAKGRRRRLDRVERLSPPPGEAGAMTVRFQAKSRGGDQPLVAERLRVEVAQRTLVDGFSTRIGRGDVIGLVGPNGAGKSTLLYTLLGERQAAGGAVRIGASERIAHYRQDLGGVPPEKSLYDIIADLRPAWTRGQVQDHLGRFDFSGDSVRRLARTLSGGERARVALAMMVLADATVLVFDEPTNHLDVESIEALEDAISDFEGTVLLVSHDRALLRNLTTRMWALSDGEVEDFPGEFGEWEERVAERARIASRAAAEAGAAARERARKAPRAAPERKNAPTTDARRVRRAVETAEAQVARAEARVTALEAELADPALYDRDGGRARADSLAADLASARAELDAAFEVWTAASEAAVGLDSGSDVR